MCVCARVRVCVCVVYVCVFAVDFVLYLFVVVMGCFKNDTPLSHASLMHLTMCVDDINLFSSGA